jgi:hypothetical protein
MLDFLRLLLEKNPNSYQKEHEELDIDEIDNLKINLIKKLEETAFIENLRSLIPIIEKIVDESYNGYFIG